MWCSDSKTNQEISNSCVFICIMQVQEVSEEESFQGNVLFSELLTPMFFTISQTKEMKVVVSRMQGLFHDSRCIEMSHQRSALPLSQGALFCSFSLGSNVAKAFVCSPHWEIQMWPMPLKISVQKCFEMSHCQSWGFINVCLFCGWVWEKIQVKNRTYWTSWCLSQHWQPSILLHWMWLHWKI